LEKRSDVDWNEYMMMMILSNDEYLYICTCFCLTLLTPFLVLHSSSLLFYSTLTNENRKFSDVAVLSRGNCELSFQTKEFFFHYGMSCRNEFFKEVDRMDKGRRRNEQEGGERIFRILGKLCRCCFILHNNERKTNVQSRNLS
jgi:hypothetical protein